MYVASLFFSSGLICDSMNALWLLCCRTAWSLSVSAAGCCTQIYARSEEQTLFSEQWPPAWCRVYPSGHLWGNNYLQKPRALWASGCSSIQGGTEICLPWYTTQFSKLIPCSQTTALLFSILSFTVWPVELFSGQRGKGHLIVQRLVRASEAATLSKKSR